MCNSRVERAAVSNWRLHLRCVTGVTQKMFPRNYAWQMVILLPTILKTPPRRALYCQSLDTDSNVKFIFLCPDEISSVDLRFRAPGWVVDYFATKQRFFF